MSECSETHHVLRTERERSFFIFLCFLFLRVQEELVETNWNLLARRRRDKCRHDMPMVARDMLVVTHGTYLWWYILSLANVSREKSNLEEYSSLVLDCSISQLPRTLRDK